MGRKGEIGTIQGLGWRSVGQLSWGSAEAEKNPGEVMIPVSGGSPGSEGILKASMETFHQAVGLWMVGGGRPVLDVKLSAKAVPESRGELGAAIRGDSSRDAKAGNPVVDEGGWRRHRRWWR